MAFLSSAPVPAASALADFESLLSLDDPIKSSTATRWERKARQQQVSVLSSSQPSQSDRYIPNRSGMDYDLHMSSLMVDENTDKNMEVSDHSKLLTSTLEKSDSKGARVLAFKNKAPAPADGYQSSMRVLYSAAGPKKEVAKPTRQISSTPFRVLDAPDMLDDYYLNLLSWGSNNVLAVALSQTVYLWNAASGEIKELMNVADDESNYISSVSWIQQGGSHIAIGTANNTVQLWDVQAGRQVRSMSGHAARVGALAWNNHILSSGSKDNMILHHDVRIQQHIVGRMATHTQEVCGLAWSPDGTYLASGANDNTLCISEAAQMSQNMSAKHVLTDHQAAVKALAWSPHERNLLASGGGTADRCIKFWNASSGALINSVDTGSQVCALQWSPFEKELLSSHGYAENQLCLWKYPSMLRVKELKAHTSRVLHMAVSPDGSMVCSGAADETLRFWNIFASESKKKSEGSSSLMVGNGANLKSSSTMRIR
jgi:cell division cycle 20, cofactor of APC complex